LSSRRDVGRVFGRRTTAEFAAQPTSHHGRRRFATTTVPPEFGGSYESECRPGGPYGALKLETTTHLELKHRAIGFLRDLGCRAVATEVGCPIARYRVDVAGYLDREHDRPDRWRSPTARPHPVDPRTVMVECKQSRGDFLRDCRQRDRLLAERAELDRLRRGIEERRVKVHEPHLRRSGSALFPELEDWDFAASRLRGYRCVIRRIRRLERQLYGETKFFMIARYRLADRLYLAAPRGLIGRGELPAGWGLLEQRRAGEPLRVAVEAPSMSTHPAHRLRMLRNIAVAASRTVLAELREPGLAVKAPRAGA